MSNMDAAPMMSTGGDSSLAPPMLISLKRGLGRQVQQWLDWSVPHIAARWVALGALVCLYALRVYLLSGFYIVTYGLGIFLLNLFIGFLSPLEEDALGGGSGDGGSDGPVLPLNDLDEFKPFIRRLPEFKFWLACSKAQLIALVLTCFSLFDVPVFWPILLVYFIVLFVLTMKRQIKHMLKHKYLPFSFGKKKYNAAAAGGGGGAGGKRVPHEDVRSK